MTDDITDTIPVMAKNKTVVEYVCDDCGATYMKETFRCSNCRGFNISEHVRTPDAPKAGLKINTRPDSSYVSKTKALTVSELNPEAIQRTSTGVPELDRVLDGGLVPGQVVLIGAEPGFGKSTLCLEVLSSFADRGIPALYATGEESAEQVADRARRLGVRSDDLKILATSSVEDVLATASEMRAGVICVDSLQAMASEALDGGLGSVSQSKEASFAFRAYAKDNGVPTLLISQFTKSDEVAGSNQIPHAVDTILVGESDDETPLKFLRSRKNRNGRTGLTAVLIHEEDGIKSVSDPSTYMIGGMDDDLSGSAKTIVNDGGRFLPVEVDALCAPAAYGTPQRQFNGIPAPRGKVLVARLTVTNPEQGLDQMDVFLSTMNNIKVSDANADLAVVAAILSSAMNAKSSKKTAWIGEVSLTGQVRGRGQILERVEEAKRLGFDRVVCSKAAYESLPDKVKNSRKIQVVGVRLLNEVVHLL